MANFWWSQKEEERKVHWVGWDKICHSKFQGGLGFKNLHTFNVTLLRNQAWQIIQNVNSLLHKVYKARYFPRYFFFAKLGTKPSYALRGIWETREHLFRSGRWRIGEGNKVRIWHDNWVLELFLLPTSLNTLGLDPSTAIVDMLMDSTSSCWNFKALHSLV